MGDVTYYGKSGLMLQSGGELVTDRKGLVTGSLVFKVRKDRWEDMPGINSEHPYAAFCVMERRRVRFDKGFWLVFGDYVGCEKDESDPVYEFNPGTGNEPIETIDNFVTEIAGKPSAPLNGAIWRDEKTGEITKDDKVGVFDRFLVNLEAGGQNPFAGLSEYLAANNTTYTKSWTRKSPPSGAENPVRIGAPPGGAPTFGGSYNWLELPPAYTQRGKVYDCRQTWVLSGPKGWNSTVYKSS